MKLKHAAVAIAAFVLWAAPAKAADKYVPPPIIPDVSEAPAAKDLWTGPYIEAGLGLSASNVDVGVVGLGNLLNIGDTAWQGHLGLGYDFRFAPHWFAGVWGRVHMDDLSYSALGTKLADTKVSYSVGGRLGFVPRGDWAVYGLVGYKFQDLDTSGAPDIGANAWLLGGGLQNYLTDNWFIGLEAVAELGESDNNAAGLKGLSVEATTYAATVRTGVRF